MLRLAVHKAYKPKELALAIVVARPLPDRSIIQKSLSTYYKMESCLPTSHLVSEAGTVTFYNEMSTEVDRVQTGGGFC